MFRFNEEIEIRLWNTCRLQKWLKGTLFCYSASLNKTRVLDNACVVLKAELWLCLLNRMIVSCFWTRHSCCGSVSASPTFICWNLQPGLKTHIFWARCSPAYDKTQREGTPAKKFEIYSLVFNEDRVGEKVEEDQFSSLRVGRTII